jgi:hypothetical protein
MPGMTRVPAAASTALMEAIDLKTRYLGILMVLGHSGFWPFGEESELRQRIQSSRRESEGSRKATRNTMRTDPLQPI